MSKLSTGIILIIAMAIPCIVSANILPENSPFGLKVTVYSIFIGIPLLFNALIEAIVGLIYAKLSKKGYKILLYQFIGNLITFIPLLVFMNKHNSAVDPNYIKFAVIAETFVVIVEMLIIKLFVRNKMTWKEVLLFSLIANVVSVMVGIYSYYLG